MHRSALNKLLSLPSAPPSMDSEIRAVTVARPVPLTELVHPAIDAVERASPTTSTTTTPCERDKVWTFLTACSVLDIRAFCKEQNVKHVGNKLPLSKRLFAKLCANRAVGTAWTSAIIEDVSNANAGCLKYGNWKSEQNSRVLWKVAPNPSTISETPPVLTQPGSRMFTVDEFGRLIVLLATDDTLRQALIASGREMSRDQLDQRISRDAFWETVVQPAFNDASRTPFGSPST